MLLEELIREARGVINDGDERRAFLSGYLKALWARYIMHYRDKAGAG